MKRLVGRACKRHAWRRCVGQGDKERGLRGECWSRHVWCVVGHRNQGGPRASGGALIAWRVHQGSAGEPSGMRCRTAIAATLASRSRSLLLVSLSEVDRASAAPPAAALGSDVASGAGAGLSAPADAAAGPAAAGAVTVAGSGAAGDAGAASGLARAAPVAGAAAAAGASAAAGTTGAAVAAGASGPAG